jgi:hypothetical protein
MSSNNLDSHFNINKFSLKNKYDEIFNKSIDECAYYSLKSNDNNDGGFEYKGNHDKCYLYETQTMNHKLNNNDLDSYNIKSFFKVKSTIDLDDNEDQQNKYNYLKKINNNFYNINGLIDNIDVSNEKECLNKCLEYPDNKCKSVIYLEEPKKCTFYKNKDMKINEKNNNSNNYSFKKDINKENAIEYLKNNIRYNYKNMDRTVNITKLKDNPILYNCNGIDSTDPFCQSSFNPDNIENNELQYYTDCLDKKYENINDQEKYFTTECKNKYGNEYVFDNDYQNLDTVMNCDKGNRAKCKINLEYDNYIEKFTNNSNICDGNCTIYKNERVSYEEYLENNNFQKKRFVLILLLFIIIIIFIYYK